MAEETFVKIGHFKDASLLAQRLRELGLDLPIDPRILSAAEGSPMAQELNIAGFTVKNRWCIHPMEGWDGTTDGRPTEYTLRRWEHFGASGAGLIWGGEAFAVQADGRANPNQIGIIDGDEARAEAGLRELLKRLTDAHVARFKSIDGVLIGLQLTHSGRFCRPYDKVKLEPKIAYHHPLLDRRFNIKPDDDSVVITDDYIERLIDNYVKAAKLAQRVGFHFVDVKHCHGYLGHEFLSAFTRKGRFGGDLEGRTRFGREIIGRIKSECPGLMIGIRVSAFDHPPFKPDPARGGGGKLGPGIPDDYKSCLPYYYGFGCNPNNPLEMDLSEPIKVFNLWADWGVPMVNVSCCSPYYNPHFQRPASFPPSDGYQPPEDPIVGVNRQIQATRQLKAACPRTVLVGTGYSYLQEYIPHVSQAVVRDGWADSVGIGRLVLSYWDMLADTLEGKEMAIKRICRTFSDCTTAPRNGIVSGCYPLDPYYKDAETHTALKDKKAAMRKALTVAQNEPKRS